MTENYTTYINEYDVTRIVAGNAETVRQNLHAALEQMGYRVISNNPLRAKHPARGCAAYFMSSIATEYPTRLEISLKPQGHGATQVTFDYTVEHGFLSKGDFQTLAREAEAIIALSLQRSRTMTCAGCGVEVAPDSRFCRMCGAPAKVAAPAEVEVLRLTAGTRGGYQWTVIGIGFLLFSALLPLWMAIQGRPMGKSVLIWLFLSAIGWWAVGAGLRRTHLTLNPKTEPEAKSLPIYAPTISAAPITNELPGTTAYQSITDHTTDLLPSPLVPEPHNSAGNPVKERFQA